MNAFATLTDDQRAGAIARHLFGGDVAVAAFDPRRDHGGLWDTERPAMARAVEARRREFTAGRCAARRAMAELGRAPAAIVSGPDRAPVWPEGIAGSITHCATACVAAVARRDRVRSIGIDIEPLVPLDTDLFGVVCSCAEQGWLAAQHGFDPGLLAKLIFAIKECVYKCQYPLTWLIFGFETLSVEIDLATATFTARFNETIGVFPAGFRIRGRVSFGSGMILAGAILRPVDVVQGSEGGAR